MTERVKVEIVPNPATGEIADYEDVMERMVDAGWTDDPKDGVTILLSDGREVVNPLPIAPPIGYNPTPSMFDVIRAQIQRAKLLEDDAVAETPDEANDFDMDDEWEPSSVYEVVMKEDFPELAPEAPSAAPPAAAPPPEPKA